MFTHTFPWNGYIKKVGTPHFFMFFLYYTSLPTFQNYIVNFIDYIHTEAYTSLLASSPSEVAQGDSKSVLCELNNLEMGRTSTQDIRYRLDLFRQ